MAETKKSKLQDANSEFVGKKLIARCKLIIPEEKKSNCEM